MATPPTAHNEQYPIGSPDQNPSIEDRAMHLAAIQSFPEQFAAAYNGLGAEQLNTPYREGGWTLRQLAHHMADSHMNAWIRLKLAVTEDWPTIKPYNEKLWAETAEVLGSIDPPVALLPPLHAHMTTLLESLTAPQWERGYVHPENGRKTLAQVAALYSWHGRHHTAHVLELRKRRGW